MIEEIKYPHSWQYDICEPIRLFAVEGEYLSVWHTDDGPAFRPATLLICKVTEVEMYQEARTKQSQEVERHVHQEIAAFGLSGGAFAACSDENYYCGIIHKRDKDNRAVVKECLHHLHSNHFDDWASHSFFEGGN